ncbi:MAG: right-handed parallel beta-helix repeat-containing protein [Bacteroidota bacterium]
MKLLIFPVLLFLLSCTPHVTEYHVSVNGSDSNDGSAAHPFKTISTASQIATAGDMITVHEGIYRERITPPRGGESDSERITYQAAEGEEVWIKGSEIISNWEKVQESVWKVTLPNSFFGDYNPYKELLEGDWYNDRGRPHHTGEVFLNGKSLFEKPSLDEVLNPEPYELAQDQEASTYTWYCESNNETTTIWANFHGYDPNEELVEINVRPACFYPDQPGRNYITIRRFHFSQAATQWAPPTAEQIGLIGTHWSKGWIIENNEISHSKCSGITLGKDRASGHNPYIRDRSKGGDVHYNEVIIKALDLGWSEEHIGSHIVRNNTIFDCEQTGICGSMGAAFSQITNNDIHDIWTKRQFEGAEIAGIKLHAPIDVLIKNNRMENTGLGLWMDWMTQGTRITGNLCYNNSRDILVEVNHGPYLVDHNIFLSDVAIYNWSEGGAYIHNLVAGFMVSGPSRRATPYHKAHSTELAGLVNIVNGDDRFFNNIFVAGETEIPEVEPEKRYKIGYGLDIFNETMLPMHVDGNIYYRGAKPFSSENNYIAAEEFDPGIQVVEKDNAVYLEFTIDSSVSDLHNALVTSKLLGKAVIPGLPYENPDGTPYSIDRDYFGNKRDPGNPVVGPFESVETGKMRIAVWPIEP